MRVKPFALKTDRLILRPFRATDLTTFAEYRSDPEVARFQSWDTPYTIEQANAFFEQMRLAKPGIAGEWYQFAIERKHQKGLIGDCALYVFSNAYEGEIGFTLARSHQKMGYATEAVMRLLDYAFSELGLHRITARCDYDNAASARLLERIGMRQEARFLENTWFKGRWSSEYGYAMLYAEWSDTRPK